MMKHGSKTMEQSELIRLELIFKVHKNIPGVLLLFTQFLK